MVAWSSFAAQNEAPDNRKYNFNIHTSSRGSSFSSDVEVLLFWGLSKELEESDGIYLEESDGMLQIALQKENI